MFNFFKKRPNGPITFERQLSILAQCDVKLSPGVAPAALLASFDREAYESDPFRLLLISMGNEPENESQAGENGYPSDDIWHFDTECVEGDGSYVAIARRLKVLAHGDLPLEEIGDRIDVDAEKACLTFRLGGRSYSWDAKVEDDWVDPAIFTRFAELLARTGTGRRFTYVDLDGQDVLIGCATDRQRRRLATETGLKVEWLA